MDMDWREILKKLNKFVCHAMNTSKIDFDQINIATIKPELTSFGFRIYFSFGERDDNEGYYCYFGIVANHGVLFYCSNDYYGNYRGQIIHNVDEARAIYDSVVDWLLEH